MKMSDEQMAQILNKNKYSVSELRWRLKLLRSHHYNESSYENLSKYIRGNIGCWKTKSIQNCNYQCMLTGSKNFEVHHLYSFSSILYETLEENCINLKDKFSDYNETELLFILDKFLEKQNEYPLGICVSKDIHKLFHNKYGKIVTPDMWCEFANNYIERIA